jgi:ribosomal protein S18 acetylase RimI-like enzyme
VIRDAGPQDVRFIQDMLRHAYYWRWGAPDTVDLPVRRYVDRWGRKGDRGVIALDEGTPVGAAWYRLFSEKDAGYGFVDETTPELSIAVVPSRRGKGLGKDLLAALLERARKDGYEQVSLSVERDNPALRLYERHGFRKVGEAGNAYTMVADLSAENRPSASISGGSATRDE